MGLEEQLIDRSEVVCSGGADGLGTRWKRSRESDRSLIWYFACCTRKPASPLRWRSPSFSTERQNKTNGNTTHRETTTTLSRYRAPSGSSPEMLVKVGFGLSSPRSRESFTMVNGLNLHALAGGGWLGERKECDVVLVLRWKYICSWHHGHLRQ